MYIIVFEFLSDDKLLTQPRRALPNAGAASRTADQLFAAAARVANVPAAHLPGATPAAGPDQIAANRLGWR